MYCKKCGKQIADDAKFCNYCGCTITTEKESVEAIEQTHDDNVSIQTDISYSRGKKLSEYMDNYAPPKPQKRIGLTFLIIYRLWIIFQILSGIGTLIMNPIDFSISYDVVTNIYLFAFRLLCFVGVIFMLLSCYNIKKYYKKYFIAFTIGWILNYVYMNLYLGYQDYTAISSIIALFIQFAILYLYLNDRNEEE